MADEKGNTPATLHPLQPWLDDFVYVVKVTRFVGRRSGEMWSKEQFDDMFGPGAALRFIHGEQGHGAGRQVRRLTFRPKVPLAHGADITPARRVRAR